MMVLNSTPSDDFVFEGTTIGGEGAIFSACTFFNSRFGGDEAFAPTKTAIYLAAATVTLGCDVENVRAAFVKFCGCDTSMSSEILDEKKRDANAVRFFTVVLQEALQTQDLKIVYRATNAIALLGELNKSVARTAIIEKLLDYNTTAAIRKTMYDPWSADVTGILASASSIIATDTKD